MTPSSTALSLVALMSLRGIGRASALKIVDGPVGETGPDDCYDLLASRIDSGKKRVSKAEFQDAWRRGEEQFQKGHGLGIQVVAFHDENYPRRLRVISDPPAVIYVKGEIRGLSLPRSLAIVGTREPTSYGECVAYRSAKRATELDFLVVSGLAHGCDTQAHRGCTEARGVGSAVLAHGLDKVYPAANRALAESLLEQGGALVSEYPVGMRPARAAFVERDRIQSGLSDAVLVIETDIRGGTMHTVRFASTQGRRVACVEHPDHLLSEQKTKGNQLLIRDGTAIPIPDGDALEGFLRGLHSRNAFVESGLPDQSRDDDHFSLVP